MQLIVDQPLAAGFNPINTGSRELYCLEGEVYNNDNKTFFPELLFAKPECDNVLQLELLRTEQIFLLPEREISLSSDFIWPFLRPYMGVIPNPKMAFIFPISCILALIFPILMKYFPKCVGKGSFPKSQIKSLLSLV